MSDEGPQRAGPGGRRGGVERHSRPCRLDGHYWHMDAPRPLLRQFARARARGAHAWVALDGEGQIVGHLCLEPVDPQRDHLEEIAVAVADDCQGHGLGHSLVAQAIGSAHRRGIVALEATMLTGNQPIHALLEHSGLPWTCRALEPGVESIRLELRGEVVQGAA